MKIDLTKLHETYGSPLECPSCGTPLETTEMDIFCPNENCKAKIQTILSQFIKKLDIKNVSVANLEVFGIDSFDKLISFRPNPSYKSQTKFYSELERKMFRTSPVNLFLALNFHGLSSILLKKIIAHYGWETIKKASEKPTEREIVEFLTAQRNGLLPSGIGNIMLEKFSENLKSNLFIVNEICDDDRYSFDGQEEDDEQNDSEENSQSICFTGSLSTMGRAAASKLAEKAGYKIKSSVTKGLTYLVTNDPNSGSSKNKKAKLYGTKIIDERQFIELVNPNTNNTDSL